ncbi:MAG: ABC transporter ATP-binding protein [Actinomycetota bacterium]|nr:ABC transporter ATP-binding protein [Actinomycetota bacterium]
MKTGTASPQTENDVVVEARGISRTFGAGEEAVHALRDVDVSVRRGELLVVTGPSGSGKSTLLHVLGGLDRPDAGRVSIEGRDLSSMSETDLTLTRRRRIGFVLQFFNLFPALTVAENVAFPLLVDGVEDAEARARTILESVSMGHRLNHRPQKLSAGEQQRVALARALVNEPAVVLADEPTGNLDSTTGRSVLDLLKSVSRSGRTIVLVTHDPVAASYGDRVLHMVDGRIEATE